MLLLATYFHASDSEAKMGNELTLLLEVFSMNEKAGGQATLPCQLLVEKTKVNLEIATTPLELFRKFLRFGTAVLP